MELSIRDFEFLDAFDHIWTDYADVYNKTKLSLFSLKINANTFDYNFLSEKILEPLLDFSLSRQVKKSYINKPMILSKKAKEKFVDYLQNKGELGELLLYCFLESHLKAPKILSKLELKTSTSHYVNGSDGVHFLKLENGDFQIIFGESKTEKDLTTALSNAFKSIYNFKNEINEKGKPKTGIRYERSLISDSLNKETFSNDEREFIKSIIYPTRYNNFEIDDAFGIFIGYEMDISKIDIKLPNAEFRKKITKKIDIDVRDRIEHVRKKIDQYNLWGHNFYIYVLPFIKLEESRIKIQEAILK